MGEVTKWGGYEVYVLNEGKEYSHIYVIEWGTITCVPNSEIHTMEDTDQ